jgi:hypothetical protein
MAVKDEQEWFQKFYEGTFLIKGWKHRMKELLQAVPESDRGHVKGLLVQIKRFAQPTFNADFDDHKAHKFFRHHKGCWPVSGLVIPSREFFSRLFHILTH